jgi:hypothetical protein
MHDGASARAFIHLRLTPGTSGTLPAGTQVLTRIQCPSGRSAWRGNLGGSENNALKVADAVFETIDAAELHSSLNELSIYPWGNRQCCLPQGATSVDLVGDVTTVLQRGAFLLFEELIGPQTGLEADADPNHRQVVTTDHD